MAETDNPEVLLELVDVSQRYRNGERVFTAVDNVNLALHAEEFVALLGPSGSGKSTLLRIITGLQAPTSGQVLYHGQPTKGVNPHATIVFQTFALFPWLTVLGNVEVALRAQNRPEEIITTTAIDLLDRVGLDGYETAYPRELSGGMRQKVGFARAMATQPELLCLDEPFSALDVLSAETLRGELMELWLNGEIPTRAILMVSHNIEEAVSMADRIVIMEKEPGRVISEMAIRLPYPRSRKDPAFLTVVDQIYALLAGQTQAEALEMGTAPGEPGPTRKLPRVSANELAGIMEALNDTPKGVIDIFRLADETGEDSERVLSLVEMAELLGFATVSKGDVTLTPLGEAFAEGSIQTRKEIFATRIRRLPFFRWLVAMLRSTERHAIELDVLLTALGLEFPPEDADLQLETAINWGRYGELFAYDDSKETLYLES